MGESVSEIKLHSRYEQLNESFRARLRPNQDLISKISNAFKRQSITGGIGFLPIFGESGSGKTSATMELGTHLPDVHVALLKNDRLANRSDILNQVRDARIAAQDRPIVAVVDQYEELVATRSELPTSFVEHLSLLDRNELQNTRIIFIWLTTSREFQELLVSATSRNKRILVDESFEISGPPKEDWPQIVEDTFRRTILTHHFQIMTYCDLTWRTWRAEKIHSVVKLRPLRSGLLTTCQTFKTCLSIGW